MKKPHRCGFLPAQISNCGRKAFISASIQWRADCPRLSAITDRKEAPCGYHGNQAQRGTADSQRDWDRPDHEGSRLPRSRQAGVGREDPGRSSRTRVTPSSGSRPRPFAAPISISSKGTSHRSPTAAFSGTRASASSRKSAPACTTVRVGDKVLVSCITSCGRCDFCRKDMYSHCRNGGWILGNRIDGTQAEYVRIPHADTSLYLVPADADEEALVMLSDILPTGFECGVLNGQVKPGDTVAIVGAGPIGLAVLLTAQFYSPAAVIMIDLDDGQAEAGGGAGRDRGHQQRRQQRRSARDGDDRRCRRRRRGRGGGHSGHLRHLSGDRRAGRAESPTSASTARPSSCTSRRCGIATSR